MRENSRAIVGEEAGHASTSVYRSVGVHGRDYRTHRIIWLHVHGRWPLGDIDHINLDKSDNRLANLRECTRRQNNANCRAKSSSASGFRGVRLHPRRNRPNRRPAWIVMLRVNGKRRWVGTYRTKEQAALAYNLAAFEAWGQFARLNYPVRILSFAA